MAEPEKVCTINPKPNDVIVAMIPAWTDPQEAAQVAERLKQEFPDNKVIVTAGVQIEAMSSEEFERLSIRG